MTQGMSAHRRQVAQSDTAVGDNIESVRWGEQALCCVNGGGGGDDNTFYEIIST